MTECYIYAVVLFVFFINTTAYLAFSGRSNPLNVNLYWISWMNLKNTALSEIWQILWPWNLADSCQMSQITPTKWLNSYTIQCMFCIELNATMQWISWNLADFMESSRFHEWNPVDFMKSGRFHSWQSWWISTTESWKMQTWSHPTQICIMLIGCL